jgi:hypothetical protein
LLPDVEENEDMFFANLLISKEKEPVKIASHSTVG